MNNIIAIIPARGGSKRIPKKNIKYLCGKPLIQYTIESALESRFLDRIIVSTENEDIAKISENLGAEVIKRPDKLALDSTPTEDVVFDIIEYMKVNQNYIPETIVLLQPTSPFRTRDDIDNAIENFRNSKCESLISVTEYDHSPYWSFKIKGGFLKSIFGGKKFLRSQELPKLFRPNGAIFIIKTNTFFKYRSFYTKLMTPFIMSYESSIDIDDEFDFLLSEFIIKNKEKKV